MASEFPYSVMVDFDKNGPGIAQQLATFADNRAFPIRITATYLGRTYDLWAGLSSDFDFVRRFA